MSLPNKKFIEERQTLGGYVIIQIVTRLRLANVFPLLFVFLSACTAPERFDYPPARKADVVEDFHGTSVADPYRWMEDESGEELKTWIDGQNRLTVGYLEKFAGRDNIENRLTELWNFPRYTVPYKRGAYYFYSRNDGLQNQSALYMEKELGKEATLVIDPNSLSEDGTVALMNQGVNHDGTLIAYGLSRSGSDWQEIRIKNLKTGKDYDEVIQWCKFAGIAWTHDKNGFFYNRYPDPTTVPKGEESYNNKVYYHRVGTPQSADQLIYERPDARELGFSPMMTLDGKYLVLHVSKGTDRQNRVYYREAASSKPFVRLLDAGDASYRLIGTVGSTFYFRTDLDAPRGRVVAIDLKSPHRKDWKEIIPQSEDVLSSVTMVNNRFAVSYLRDVRHRVILFTRDGAVEKELELPGIGTVSGLSGRPSDTELFFNFTSFLYPPTVFRYDFTTGILSALRDTEIDFDISAYETDQVFFTSKDGTRIPMFLTHRKGLQRNGNNPVLLFGYGGFNVSMNPSFNAARLVWLEHGGIYAQANLRGGGEYGEEWHRAGMLEKKQNVFDDFISAAEWLIENKYTQTSRLAIMGASNGGLLVSASMLQRPKLFGAVVCQVPVTDMLRYHKFTVGRFWVGEYGNAETNPEHFKFMYAYSPLHNVEPGASYPPIFITTADHDDRVVPAHAMKFGATLQAAGGGSTPILVRVETKAGHGGGKPVSKQIEEWRDIYAFLMKTFRMSAE